MSASSNRVEITSWQPEEEVTALLDEIKDLHMQVQAAHDRARERDDLIVAASRAGVSGYKLAKILGVAESTIGRVVKKNQAAPGFLSATLRASNAWGKIRTVEVVWLPQVAYGVDLGLDNVGTSPIVWADEPPIYLTSGQAGDVRIRKNTRRISGDYEGVFEPREVDAVEDLTPGAYVLLTDDDPGCE